MEQIMLAHTVSLDEQLEVIGKKLLADGLVVDNATPVNIKITDDTIDLWISYVCICFHMKTASVILMAMPHEATIYKNEYWSDWKRADIFTSIDTFLYEMKNVWS